MQTVLHTSNSRECSSHLRTCLWHWWMDFKAQYLCWEPWKASLLFADDLILFTSLISILALCVAHGTGWNAMCSDRRTSGLSGRLWSRRWMLWWRHCTCCAFTGPGAVGNYWKNKLINISSINKGCLAQSWRQCWGVSSFWMNSCFWGQKNCKSVRFKESTASFPSMQREYIPGTVITLQQYIMAQICYCSIYLLKNRERLDLLDVV